MSNIRLLIIEDHAAVRRALVNRLSSNPELQVEAADSLADGLKRVEAAHPDVVLLDSRGKRGLEALGQLAGQARVIVLTTFSDDDERAAALKAGARRYWLKEINSPRLIKEIQAVAAEPLPAPA